MAWKPKRVEVAIHYARLRHLFLYFLHWVPPIRICKQQLVLEAARFAALAILFSGVRYIYLFPILTMAFSTLSCQCLLRNAYLLSSRVVSAALFQAVLNRREINRERGASPSRGPASALTGGEQNQYYERPVASNQTEPESPGYRGQAGSGSPCWFAPFYA